MRLPVRDVVATVLVAAAMLMYVLWAANAAPGGLDDVRSIGLVVLALGFAASASAVVPGFDQLMHGNRVYLAATTVLGLVALTGGVWMLWDSSEAGLAILVGSMAVLWLVATLHHAMLARTGEASTPAHAPRRRAAH